MSMRHIIPATCTLIMAIGLGTVSYAQNDIENVFVETYYVSDANDATDTIGGGLESGSRTYRVFIDLAPGRRLRALYGREGHPLTIQSTALIFNHEDRGKRYGHEVNNAALDEGVAALDSWLSLGAASNQRTGVRKSLDTDGSILGGVNNDGGSALVAAGLLNNNTPEMGIALTVQDGLLTNPGNVIPPNFLVIGDDPQLAFGNASSVNGFSSTAIRIGCSTPGVAGVQETNELLVAQITTTGELSFSLNVEIELADGTVVRYVAQNDSLAADETANGSLKYPAVCGCTDPNFLEYDASAGCDDGSCHTNIIFGCLDTLACNYDGAANFHIAQLCCFGPTDCNGLDISIICPGVGMNEVDHGSMFTIAPNPITEQRIRVLHASAGLHAYTLLDVTGRKVKDGTVHATGTSEFLISTDDLRPGTYVLVLATGRTRTTQRVIIP